MLFGLVSFEICSCGVGNARLDAILMVALSVSGKTFI